MKVLIVASPFASLSAREVCAIAEKAWISVRADDELIVRPVSDGRPNMCGFSGLHEVIGGAEVSPSEVDYSMCDEGSAEVHRGLGRARENLHIWRSDSAALIDCTAVASYTGSGDMSSDFLGAELLWARRAGLREVIIALPSESDIADLGKGMLRVLAGESGSDNNSVSDFCDVDSCAKALAEARKQLEGMRLVVLAANAQRLTGFSGIARTRMRHGLDSQVAQDLDSVIGEYADTLAWAHKQTLGRSHFLDVPENPDMRGEYAGAGGGVAFALQCLGSRLYSVGDMSVRSRLAEQIKNVDVLVYISGAIEADLPSGLLAALDVAQAEPPVVLIYDYGAIAKGELRQLGLSGAYELRPHLAFLHDASPSSGESAGESPQEPLAERVMSVAQTWGW